MAGAVKRFLERCYIALHRPIYRYLADIERSIASAPNDNEVTQLTRSYEQLSERVAALEGISLWRRPTQAPASVDPEEEEVLRALTKVAEYAPGPDHALCISVSGSPKSASTFVWRVLSNVAGVEGSRSTLSTMHELDVDDIIRKTIQVGAWVCHSHVVAGPHTLQICDRFSIKSIVTVRNLLDSLVSLREEWQRQWNVTTLNSIHALGGSVQFCGFVPIEIVERFIKADHPIQMDIVIELACAWYVCFIQSWQAAARTRPTDVRFCELEMLQADEIEEMDRIARFVGLHAPRDRIAAACAKIKSHRNVANINVGRSGRGREFLRDHQFDRIQAILDTLGVDDDLRRYLVAGEIGAGLFPAVA